jgi:hypothetical protein
MSTATNRTITEAERLAFNASLPDIDKIGDRPHFAIVIGCQRATDEVDGRVDRVIFEVRATADGMGITPMQTKSPLAAAYAADVQALSNEIRKRSRDNQVYHLLGAGMRPFAGVVDRGVDRPGADRQGCSQPLAA